MAKQSGLGDRLYVDGYNLSGDIGSLARINGGPAPGEVTAIDKLAFERLGLLRTGGMEFTSWFNPSANQEHAVLKALPYGDRIVTYFRGTAVGGQSASLVGKQLNYDPNRGADGSLALNTSVESNGYGLEWGDMLTAGARTDTVATNGTSVDGLASSAFGGQAYLHVEAFTGTSVTVTIQDSADNSAWANVTGGAFVAATARGAQRLAIPGTIRRYVRATTTGTFSNAVFLVTFSRNLTAVTF